MVRSSAIVILLAFIALCAWAEAAPGKNARARQPAAQRSAPVTGPAAQRHKQPVARTPTQDEKSWMDRASAPSSGGGMGM